MYDIGSFEDVIALIAFVSAMQRVRGVTVSGRGYRDNFSRETPETLHV